MQNQIACNVQFCLLADVGGSADDRKQCEHRNFENCYPKMYAHDAYTM